MTPRLDTMLDLCKRATPGPWHYEAERYSAKHVIGIKPIDDRWLAHAQPEFNGKNNGQLIASCDPQTIEAMIGLLKEARELLWIRTDQDREWVAKFDEFNKEVAG